MGQPASVQEQADPAMWVMARQYTGRIVTVSNGEIFKEPIYNYSRDYPFLWEEIMMPVAYDGDDARAERILLEVARKHTTPIEEMTAHAREHLKRIYDLDPPSVRPRVYYRLTDNWIALTLRFVVPDRGIREIKDAMYRDILRGFREAGIDVASSTYDIVGLPPVRIEPAPPGTRGQARRVVEGTAVMKATIQLCTYNRAALLERVLDACFEQTVPADSYEVVLVNDGSTDGTPAVIERARNRAHAAFYRRRSAEFRSRARA